MAWHARISAWHGMPVLAHAILTSPSLDHRALGTTVSLALSSHLPRNIFTALHYSRLMWVRWIQYRRHVAQQIEKPYKVGEDVWTRLLTPEGSK